MNDKLFYDRIDYIYKNYVKREYLFLLLKVRMFLKRITLKLVCGFIRIRVKSKV